MVGIVPLLRQQTFTRDCAIADFAHKLRSRLAFVSELAGRFDRSSRDQVPRATTQGKSR
jgi:hypothetical protein